MYSSKLQVQDNKGTPLSMAVHGPPLPACWTQNIWTPHVEPPYRYRSAPKSVTSPQLQTTTRSSLTIKKEPLSSAAVYCIDSISPKVLPTIQILSIFSSCLSALGVRGSLDLTIRDRNSKANMAANSGAASLLRRQLKQMQSDKDIPGISCGLVNDDNIFEWEVMLMINDEVKWYGGMYPSFPPPLQKERRHLPS